MTDELHDFADSADDLVGRYRLEFHISPPLLQEVLSNPPLLTWQSIPHGREHQTAVPNDKRGVYAFVIATPATFLPTHGYVCYIGMSGKDSNRSLRDRYSDYFNRRAVRKRVHLARMFARWESVLRFFFAPVADSVSSTQIQEIELALNDAFLPPFSKADYSAEVSELRRAFQ